MGDPTVDTGFGLFLDFVVLWVVLIGLGVMIWLSRSDKPGKPKKPMR